MMSVTHVLPVGSAAARYHNDLSGATMTVTMTKPTAVHIGGYSRLAQDRE
jgi:hypothetical protein